MKSALYSLLAISLYLLSCKKEQPDLSDQIKGRWELRQVNGHWSGKVTYPAGNGDILEFSTSTYTHYYPNAITRSGTYRLVKDTSSMYGQVRDFILYDNSSMPMEMISLTEGKLSLEIDAVDAGGRLYERMD